MTGEERPAPRICVCVLMNHPFPANLPLLRRIWGRRFGMVRFLIPFERMPDEPDVITVYRGSYTHAGYLTDAQHILAGIDCDHFVVVHDDVLLNPRIGEDNFYDIFRLGPDDGLVPRVRGVLPELGRWSWLYSLVPRLLFPKSQLFGTGIDPANLVKYLPAAELLAARLAAAGIAPTTRVRLDETALDDLTIAPSRFLLHGLWGHVPDGPETEEALSACLEIEARLLEVMNHFHDRPRDADDPKALTLPFPIVTAAFLTDFYIVPKSGMADYCHYAGIASAAQLFVELTAPALLFACCERVWTETDFGLDFSGFDLPTKGLDHFTEPRRVALHPIKLSTFSRDAKDGDALLHQLDLIAGGADGRDPAILEALAFATRFAPALPGWHQGEHWGVWSAAHEAVIPIVLPRPGRVRLTLLAPVDGAVVPEIAGRVIFGADDTAIAFTARHPERTIVLDLPELVPDADGIARVRLVSDRLVCPGEVHPGSPDTRRLGMGVVMIERPDAGDPPVRDGHANARPNERTTGE